MHRPDFRGFETACARQEGDRPQLTDHPGASTPTSPHLVLATCTRPSSAMTRNVSSRHMGRLSSQFVLSLSCHTDRVADGTLRDVDAGYPEMNTSESEGEVRRYHGKRYPTLPSRRTSVGRDAFPVGKHGSPPLDLPSRLRRVGGWLLLSLRPIGTCRDLCLPIRRGARGSEIAWFSGHQASSRHCPLTGRSLPGLTPRL